MDNLYSSVIALYDAIIENKSVACFEVIFRNGVIVKVETNTTYGIRVSSKTSSTLVPIMVPFGDTAAVIDAINQFLKEDGFNSFIQAIILADRDCQSIIDIEGITSRTYRAELYGRLFGKDRTHKYVLHEKYGVYLTYHEVDLTEDGNNCIDHKITVHVDTHDKYHWSYPLYEA